MALEIDSRFVMDRVMYVELVFTLTTIKLYIERQRSNYILHQLLTHLTVLGATFFYAFIHHGNITKSHND